MARKTLLTESEIRNFLKLANLPHVGDDRIEEMYGSTEDLDEGEDLDEAEDLEERGGAMPKPKKKNKGMREGDDEERADDKNKPGMKSYGMEESDHGDTVEEMDDEDRDMPDADAPMGDMGGMDDMGDDADAGMDMDMDMGAAGGSKMVSVDDFMGALETALERVLDDEVEVDMDDDGMDDDDMGGDDMPDMGDEAMAAMAGDEDPAGMGGRPMMEEEDIVNEVARRVAARLQAKNDKAEMVDQLAERILNRLTSK